MDLSHRPTKILVTGASGTGKTTYWTRYLCGTPAAVRFVFDHQGETAIRLHARPAQTADQLAAAVHDGWVIFDPSALFPGRLEEAFAFFCEFAFEASTRLAGRKLFACDELQVLVGTMQIRPELALVLETGRRYQLDAVMISQQPNLIHNRVRNQLTEVVTFRQMDQNAVGWLEQAGFSADQVRALRPGAFIARNLQTGGQSVGSVF